jgi:hypothetical protein
MPNNSANTYIYAKEENIIKTGMLKTEKSKPKFKLINMTLRKKFNAIFSGLLLLTLVACNNSNPAAKLIGKWRMVFTESKMASSLIDEQTVEFFPDNKYLFTTRFKSVPSSGGSGLYKISNDTLYCYSENGISKYYAHGKFSFLSETKFEFHVETGKEVYEKIENGK